MNAHIVISLQWLSGMSVGLYEYNLCVIVLYFFTHDANQGATVQQMSHLKRMAELELVGLIPLQVDCDAVLCPYLNKAGHVKVVSWLAELLT